MTAAYPDHLLIHGDARHIPLADGSVHCCACSPPFFGLRDYGTGRWEGGDPACDHLESKPSRTGASIAASGLLGGKGTVHLSHVYRGECGLCGARRVDRQIGLEPTVEAFVAAIVAVGREVWRVLRDDGSWWLNLGDSYVTNPGNGRGGEGSGLDKGGKPPHRSGIDRTRVGLKPKDLCLIPERVVLALQADGWVVRAKPPWIKPSPMPESAADRPNVAHESIFLLTKGPRYYFDMEAVRVPSRPETLGRDRYSRITKGKDGPYGVQHDHETPSDPAGRHLRTNDFFAASLDAAIDYHEAQLDHLRQIKEKGGLLSSEAGDPLALLVGAQSFNGAHFAVWPERLVRWMVKASTSEEGCCAACGAPMVRIGEKVGEIPQTPRRRSLVRNEVDRSTRSGGTNRSTLGAGNGGDVSLAHTSTLGWRPSCRCNSQLPPQPCTVLDPFVGSGTTILTALALGRRAVGVDLSREYLGMATGRIAAGLRPASRYDPERPKKPLDGQLSLFDDPSEEEVPA